MFIKESMRLNPPVPVVGRCLNKPMTLPDSKLSHVTIPENLNVALVIIVNHKNPEIWNDPEVNCHLLLSNLLICLQRLYWFLQMNIQ